MGEEERPDEVDVPEEEAPQTEDAPVSASTSKIVKILLYAIGAILLMFIVVGVSYLVTKYVQEMRYEREQAIIIAPPPAPLSHFDLPSFSTTTKDEEPHFAKLTISLGYEENVVLNAELVRRIVQLQHIINIILRGKKITDLDSIEDTINLSKEIKAHVNVILSTGKIKEVYFREFIIN